MSGFVHVDVSQLEAAAQEIGIAASVVQRTAYRAINGVAAKGMTRARREIVSQVNLSATYVRERISLRKAGPNSLRAVIAGRQRATRLATYGARQVTKKATHGNGDPLRGIVAGRKQAGISVNVKRGGSRKTMKGAFLIPLRAGQVGGANGMGIFIRTGPGKKDIVHKYGPSVDDVLSGVIDTLQPDIQSELEAALIRQARYEFGKALKAT